MIKWLTSLWNRFKLRRKQKQFFASLRQVRDIPGRKFNRQRRSRWDFLSFFVTFRYPMHGDPNLHTRPTAKGHIHRLNHAATPSRGRISPAEYRRIMKQRRTTSEPRRIATANEIARAELAELMARSAEIEQKFLAER